MGAVQSLIRRNHQLSDPQFQLEVLNGKTEFIESQVPFSSRLQEMGEWPMKPHKLEILQINVGYMCNQTCKHCHVDAGPTRKEIMTRETMQDVVAFIQQSGVHTLDLTGGAPEMNPDFRWFVEESKKAGVQEIIVRSNLTIFSANPKYNDLPEFFAKNKVRVVSSLPYFKKSKTDRQRGDGVFDRSIEALKQLNEIGYGKPGRGLFLDLVYNPSGAFLPADQAGLEMEFKEHLAADYGIVFNQLFALTNLPISRFLEYLIASDNLEEYMGKLITAFNSAAVEGVMCKNTLSVDWRGNLYDCDFNQMLNMPIQASAGKHISEIDIDSIQKRAIKVNQHCYGCTAGAGSSCQGTVV